MLVKPCSSQDNLSIVTDNILKGGCTLNHKFITHTVTTSQIRVNTITNLVSYKQATKDKNNKK